MELLQSAYAIKLILKEIPYASSNFVNVLAYGYSTNRACRPQATPSRHESCLYALTNPPWIQTRIGSKDKILFLPT